MQDSFKQIILVLITSTFIIFLFLAFIFTIMFLYKNKQRRLKSDLQFLKLDHEKNILTTQLEIQEQTFRNISQEIHDNISLSLTLAKLNLNTYNMKPEATENELVESSIDLISKALVDLNDISKSMDSDLIESHGLIHAIEFEVELLQKTGLHTIVFTVTGDTIYMDAAKELILFRMIQESCNNILKHADAKNIFIDLVYMTDKLTISIRDDGKGFDQANGNRPKNIRSNAGLKNMQQRAELINGTSRIMSQPQKGTTVIFEIPIIPSNANEEKN